MLEATGFALFILYLLGVMGSGIFWMFLQILVVLSVGIVLLRVFHKPQTMGSGKLNSIMGLTLGHYSNV